MLYPEEGTRVTVRSTLSERKGHPCICSAIYARVQYSGFFCVAWACLSPLSVRRMDDELTFDLSQSCFVANRGRRRGAISSSTFSESRREATSRGTMATQSSTVNAEPHDSSLWYLSDADAVGCSLPNGVQSSAEEDLNRNRLKLLPCKESTSRGSRRIGP